MIKYRLLTIAVLLPLLLWGIYSLSAASFMWVSLLVALWIAWEWSYVSKLTSIILRLLYVVVCAALCFMAAHIIAWPILLCSAVFWILALLAVVNYASGTPSKWLNSLFLRLLAGCLVITAFWESMQVLRALPNGVNWLLYGLAIVWVADSAAYVGGRLMGRTLLAERVSPKKTWQGVWTGIIACALLSLVGKFWLGIDGRHVWQFVAITLVAAIWSVVGDLFESVLKRRSGIKDSGNLLPGHGGILDRTDALLAGLPWFALGVLLLRFYNI